MYEDELARKSKMLINRDKELLALNDEIERLNNIINELEQWLSVRIDNFNANVSEPIYHEYIAIRLVYDYLQELKGESK